MAIIIFANDGKHLFILHLIKGEWFKIDFFGSFVNIRIKKINPLALNKYIKNKEYYIFKCKEYTVFRPPYTIMCSCVSLARLYLGIDKAIYTPNQFRSYLCGKKVNTLKNIVVGWFYYFLLRFKNERNIVNCNI